VVPDGDGETVAHSFVVDSVGETGGSAASFLELHSSGGKFLGDSSVNLSVCDHLSGQLDAVSLFDGVDHLITTPFSAFSRSADMEASPFSAFGGISAFAPFGINTVSSSSVFKLGDFGFRTGCIIASSVVPSVDGCKLDDIGGINTFVGSTDFISVTVLAPDWSFSALAPSEVFSVFGGGLSEHLNSLIRGGERNAGTVVVHMDGLVEHGHWDHVEHGSTGTEFLKGDSVFILLMNKVHTGFAWTVFEVNAMCSACVVDSFSQLHVVGVKLPAVARMPDVTCDEIGDSFNGEHM